MTTLNRISLMVLLLLFAVCCVCDAAASNKAATPRRNKATPTKPKEESGTSPFRRLIDQVTGKNATEETDAILEPTKGRSRRSERKKKSTKEKQPSTNTTEPWIVKNIEKPKNAGWSWWLQKQKKEKGAKSGDETKDGKQEGSSKKATPTPSSDKEAAPSPSNTTSITDTPQQQPNGTTALLYMRPQQQVAPPLFMAPQGRGRAGSRGAGGKPIDMSPSNLLLANAAATLLSNIFRLWFITYITKKWSFEESMRPTQHFVWERLNDRYVKDQNAIDSAMAAAPLDMSERKWRGIVRRRKRKPPKPAYETKDTFDRTVLVVEVKHPKDKGGGPIDVKHLEQIATFILTQHRRHAFGTTVNEDNPTSTRPNELEVVFLVESFGGRVTDFGLAAAQVERLSREEGIVTTVCVDNMAASGGYMIASQAHHVCAAPFAMLGSVGVISENLNFHNALEKFGIQPLVLKSGDAKSPISAFGQVSKADLRVAQENMDKTHLAFQQLVLKARPVLEETLTSVLNGDVYIGSEAKELCLVDRVVTSEEYLLERITEGNRVLKLHKSHQSRFPRNFVPSPLDLIRHSLPVGALFDSQRFQRFLNSESVATVLSRMLHTGSMLGLVQYLWGKCRSF